MLSDSTEDASLGCRLLTLGLPSRDRHAQNDAVVTVTAIKESKTSTRDKKNIHRMTLLTLTLNKLKDCNAHKLTLSNWTEDASLDCSLLARGL